MKLRRTTCVGLFACGALAVLLLDPQYTSGQPGGFGKGGGRDGGFGKGGGFGGGQPGGGFGQPGGGQPGGFGGGKNPFTDPDTVFNFYSKGADVIDFSRMDPNMKAFAKRGFEKAGMPAPGDNTVITKAQFVDSFTKALAAKGVTPGGSPTPAPGFGGPPGGQSGTTMTFRMDGGPGGSRGFGGPPGGGFGGPPGGGFGGPPGGNPWGSRDAGSSSWGGPQGNNGWGGRDGGNGSSEREKMGGPTNFRLTDRDIEDRFNSSDANHDGKLSEDELSDRSPLRASFKESDTNKDGYIDLQEYKAYIAARFGGDSGDQASYGSYAGNGNYGRENGDRRNEKQEQPVIAIRYGKLPTGLPSWWDTLDTDKDGQIGLYEWRADGRDMKEFQKMDLDGDGIVAPQEWFRYNTLSAEQAKAIAAEEEINGTGSGSTRSGRTGGSSYGAPSSSGGGGNKGNWPGSGPGGKDKGSEKSSDKSDRPSDKDSKNPFRTGGKK